MLDNADQFTGGQNRHAHIQRPGRMVLDPLTEIGIRMLMTIVIGGGQLVVNILRDGKRGQPKEDKNHPQCEHHTEKNQRTMDCGLHKHP